MKHPQVLCIEDEEDFRTSLVDFLKSEGYAPMEAKNGREGLQVITENKPHLVLCDVSMPEMTGFQLLTELRAFHPQHAHVPFIFLTALGQKKDLMTGHMLGADDYILKPVDFDVLAVTIRARLEQSERQRKHIDNEMNVFRSLVLQMLAYEMRIPINAVIGQSELLRGRLQQIQLDESALRMAGGLRELGHELLSMLNNSVDALALANGLVTLQEQPVDLESLLWECVQSFKMSAACEGIRFQHSIESNLPMLRADPWLLSRMMLVLLFDAARSKLAARQMVLDVHTDTEGYMVVSLSDPKATLNDRYHDISPITWEAENGAACPYPKGINLQFVKAVMNAHGGNASVMKLDNAFGGVVLRFPPERVEKGRDQ